MVAVKSSPIPAGNGEPPLSAPLTLSYDYTRSVGPVLGAFFTALRERRILGVRGTDGRVHVPPVEYDPVTCEPLGELVPVAEVGTVLTWTWQYTPLDGQPLQRPFAYALIKLDGADTPMLHAVDVGEPGPAGISAGTRVSVRWSDETIGAITDIAHFELGEPAPHADTSGEKPDQRDPVQMIVTPITVEIEHSAAREEAVYLKALEEGRLLGARTLESDGAGAVQKGNVYFPPHGAADPSTGRPYGEMVELPNTGTVTTFAIINIPFAGQKIKPPYVAAYILLDGADIPFLHLVTEIDAADVRMGMRVEAVWKPREEWGPGIDNIDHFRPTGEPDADYDTYKHHL